MNRKCIGYKYEPTEGEDRFSVSTDYGNNRIYLDPPDEDDLDGMLEFGKAIVKAVMDMKKDIKRGLAEEV